jgi:hypothetical protein
MFSNTMDGVASVTERPLMPGGNLIDRPVCPYYYLFGLIIALKTTEIVQCHCMMNSVTR